MPSILVAIFCAAAAALNTVLYVSSGDAWNLGGAIFCGVLVVINLVAAAVFK